MDQRPAASGASPSRHAGDVGREPSNDSGEPDRSNAEQRRRRLIVGACASVVVPFTVFATRVGLWTLNPLAAPRMISEDWATYIAAPNFLRTAPLLTFPLGQTPDYIAPVGSSLAMADATPIMMPVYRLLNAAFPDKPTQLLGWLVLAGYVLTFYWSVKFLRRAYRSLRRTTPWLLVEVGIHIAGALLLLLPVFTSRIVHTALTQQWILIAALYCALFRVQPSPRNDRYVFAVCVGAAVLQPYFILPALVVSAPYLLRRLWEQRQRGAGLMGAIAGGVVAVSFLLGYLTVGAESQIDGYGYYAADLTFLVNSQGTSKLLPATPYAPATWEGIGFLGSGVLIVVIASIVAVTGRAVHRRPRRHVVLTSLSCVALGLFACWPILHVAGYELVDLSGGPLSLDFVGDVMRGNGRFVWSLTWLVALGACAIVLSASWRPGLTVLVLSAALVVQFADSEVVKFADRGDADYAQVAGIVSQQRDNGVTRIEVQPPRIQHACVPMEIPYDDLMPVVVAGAVLRLPVNSGYPGRSAAKFESEICGRQVSAFAAGEYQRDVLYVLNQANSAAVELDCEPLVGSLVACRTPS